MNRLFFLLQMKNNLNFSFGRFSITCVGGISGCCGILILISVLRSHRFVFFAVSLLMKILSSSRVRVDDGCSNETQRRRTRRLIFRSMKFIGSWKITHQLCIRKVKQHSDTLWELRVWVWRKIFSISSRFSIRTSQQQQKRGNVAKLPKQRWCWINI